MASTLQSVQQDENKVGIMIDSGAATHVCPPWFAPNTPMYNLEHGQGPQLRTATDENIPVYGYKWVLMTNVNKQQLVVPFFVCEVTQPILSVTRLAEQGFNIQLNEIPTVTHTKGFNSALAQRDGLYFMTMEFVNIPVNMQLEVHQRTQGTTAKITPVTLTPAGMEVLRNRNDLWSFNNQGYLVRVHRPQRKALFVPDQRCPVPTARLENYRRTIVRRNNGDNENIEDAYQTLDTKQQKRILEGEPWAGETWFKVKRGTPLPGNTPPMPALPATRTTVPTASNPTSAQAADHPTGRMRYTAKQPPSDPTRATGSTSVPHPMSVPPTTDYWIREGHLWKRVHVKPRHDLYIPQQTDDGPDVTKLTTERTTMVRPTNGARWYRIDDNWTTKRQATLDQEWTGSTNFEEKTTYKDECITDDVEEQQEARKAKGLPAPQQPTAQERLEHELTHLPYRSWCPVCVQAKGRSDYHPKQHNKTPVIQCDITYYEAIGEQATSSIFTAIDVETGMCMAAQVEDKTQSMQYLSTCLQQFLMECGRTHAVLNNTVIQSDNEDFLKALLKATATAMGSNIAVRQSPAYTSQAQGSVERFHRTLMGQVRALKLQLENNYNTRLTSKHPIMPWMVKHAAYLLNRYAVHADGNTSYYRRWNKEHKTPICEFGETVLYMLPTAKQLPKMEARFFPAIWLGKDTSTNENILGITNKVVRSRTIRRQVKPEKYNKQLLDVINSTPMTTPTASSFVMLPTAKMMARPKTTTETQTSLQQEEQFPTTAAQSPTHTSQPPAITDLPRATAPPTQRARAPLPVPTPKREVTD